MKWRHQRNPVLRHLILHEKEHGILIGLNALLKRFDGLNVPLWWFECDEWQACGERREAALDLVWRAERNGGSALDQDDLRLLRSAEIQIIDGVFQALDEEARPLFELECFDSSFWLFRAEKWDYIQVAIEAGFVPDKHAESTADTKELKPRYEG